jgi:glycine hydroxymethyltransferase
MVSSGLRLGTPALATRGFALAEFTELGDVVERRLPALGRVPRGSPSSF